MTELQLQISIKHTTFLDQKALGRTDRRPSHCSYSIPASPDEAAITRLVGALLLEQSDEWAVQRTRYMTLETIAPLGESDNVSLPVLAA